MAPGQEPLLARRPSSEDENDDQNITEEDALLTGQNTSQARRRPRWHLWAQIGSFTWAFCATIAVIVLSVWYEEATSTAHVHATSTPGNSASKRNLIFMVSDGMGPTSLSMTRTFNQHVHGLPESHTLSLDQHLIGSSRTRSTTGPITDSAAGATAFSCAMKSYNGAISILPDGTPCGSVLEAAKKAGYMTGLVVTTRVTDATPACFAAHVETRTMEDRIAEHMLGDYPLGRTVDLILGGGRKHFLPNTTEGSARVDNRDMIAWAKDQGWDYISTREEFDGLKRGSKVHLPLLGLFAEGDIPYKLDRNESVYPNLEEMAETALTALSAATRHRKKGFFIMIEGSRIDHAGHTNDPGAQVHEVLEYDRTFQKAVDFVENDTHAEGVVVSTSDHETGGLATARQNHWELSPTYDWYPTALAKARHSTGWLAADFMRYLTSHADEDSSSAAPNITAYLLDSLSTQLGITDPSPEELDELIESPLLSTYTFSEILSRRARIGWTTLGHSAVDVNVYSSSRSHAEPLFGNVENTEVGTFLTSWLGVEDKQRAVTEMLRQALDSDEASRKGSRVGIDKKITVDEYHGDL